MTGQSSPAIRFLHAKGETAAEIHRQLVSVYGKDVM
jgi:hypothetical protein